MPNTTYAAPTVPDRHTDRQAEYLDGHAIGWQDAQNDNTGHGTEPSAEMECPAWYDGWDDGVRAFEAATR
jgi:hypothetical protein